MSNIEAIQQRLTDLKALLPQWPASLVFPKLDAERSLDGQARPFEAITQALGEICALYLEASDPEREQIRAFFRDDSKLENLLLSYVYYATDRLKQSKDAQWLRLGLAAASIEDERFDYRDSLMALSTLYLISLRVGIDPDPEFQAVSRLSSSEHFFNGNTRDMLTQFSERRAMGILGKLPD